MLRSDFAMLSSSSILTSSAFLFGRSLQVLGLTLASSLLFTNAISILTYVTCVMSMGGVFLATTQRAWRTMRAINRKHVSGKDGAMDGYKDHVPMVHMRAAVADSMHVTCTVDSPPHQCHTHRRIIHHIRDRTEICRNDTVR